MATVESGMTVVQQAYLLQARQMQALSFIVHIPLVCFGIAFPAMVLFIEWRYLRTGDEITRRSPDAGRRSSSRSSRPAS